MYYIHMYMKYKGLKMWAVIAFSRKKIFFTQLFGDFDKKEPIIFSKEKESCKKTTQNNNN